MYVTSWRPQPERCLTLPSEKPSTSKQEQLAWHDAGDGMSFASAANRKGKLVPVGHIRRESQLMWVARYYREGRSHKVRGRARAVECIEQQRKDAQ